MRSTQCLQNGGLQCYPKREPSHRHQRRPSTPGSPQDVASFSLPSVDHTPRLGSYTEPPAIDAQSIPDRLGNIPQELYDKILLFSLVYDAGGEMFPSATANGSPITNAQYIDNSYRPPVQLAINRKIRQDTTQKYYRDTTFILSDHGVLQKWVRSLSREAMAEIKEARVVEATASCISTGTYRRPNYVIGQQDDSGDIWKTWDLKIETRQYRVGQDTRAQELVSVRANHASASER